MRLTKEQLQDVKKKFNVDRLWSWSMVDTFIISPYCYYLKYIKHAKEDADNCAYATLGSICHSIIEDLHNNKIKPEEMNDIFDDGWLTAIDIADLKFDRNDESKNSSISKKYKENLEHFFSHHDYKRFTSKLALEKFIAADINGNILQGYIDAVYKNEDGTFDIIDWKTSTQYKGKTAEEKCGQLVVYAIALNQMGVPFDKIRICWNFLKYVTIEYQQKNGTIKTRDVERCKIGEALQSNAKTWLKACGYSESQINDYLQKLLDENSIDVLPEEVKEKYVITDCYTYVPLTDKLVEHWKETITTTINDILLREKDYAETENDKCFWDSEESVKAQSYYFATLCGYSPRLHLPYKEYLEKREAAANGGDMFGGVGSDIETTSINIKSSNDSGIDLSWLDSI